MLGMLLGAIALFAIVYLAVFVSGLFVRLIMRSLERVHQLTVHGLALWALGTSMLVMLFETLGRFFLLSIDIQLQFATHIMGVLLLHVLYFIVAGLAVRAVITRHHQVSISARDAVVFMACVGICFYFLLGSMAGALAYVAEKYENTKNIQMPYTMRMLYDR